MQHTISWHIKSTTNKPRFVREQGIDGADALELSGGQLPVLLHRTVRVDTQGKLIRQFKWVHDIGSKIVSRAPQNFHL